MKPFEPHPFLAVSGVAAGVLPYLGAEALAGLEMLGMPLYIYSFISEKVCWCNAAALFFWNSSSTEELYSRVLTPYSSSTQTRLQSYREAFWRGEILEETWTYYPRGQASPAISRCTGVRVDGHDEAMLVELTPLSALNVSLPLHELRALEALRHTPLMITLFSEAGAVLMGNPASQRFFGGLADPPSEGEDRFAAMFANWGDGEKLRAQVGFTGHATCTAIMGTTDGQTHYVEASRVTDPVTALPALLVTQNDISLSVSALRQMAESEDALDAVLGLNAFPVVVLALDDLHVLRTNLALESFIGRSLSPNEGVADLFWDEDAFQAFLGMSLTSQQGQGSHFRLKTADGSPRWAQISLVLITFEQRRAVVMFMIDVDWLYRTSDVLKQELGSEREVARLQRRVLAVASHDVRTPLAVIDSVAQRLVRQAGVLSAEELVTRAARVRESVQRIVNLLENTLERVRDDGVQNLNYRPEMGPLADSIVSVVHSFEEMHTYASILCDLPQLPEMSFDRALIEQALANVLDNALKFSRGIAQIEVTATCLAWGVEIFVRDHGIGVLESERSAIFKERRRGSNVEAIEGTGLGLSIVRQIVDLHGGQVDFVPVEGAGAMVRIALPR